MDKKRFLLPLWAGGWFGYEVHEVASEARPESVPSAVAWVREVPRQHHSETGATGEAYRPHQNSGQSSAATVIDDDDGWMASYVQQVAGRSLRSSQTFFAPSSYTEF